jgi:hypothetical protein
VSRPWPQPSSRRVFAPASWKSAAARSPKSLGSAWNGAGRVARPGPVDSLAVRGEVLPPVRSRRSTPHHAAMPHAAHHAAACNGFGQTPGLRSLAPCASHDARQPDDPAQPEQDSRHRDDPPSPLHDLPPSARQPGVRCVESASARQVSRISLLRSTIVCVEPVGVREGWEVNHQGVALEGTGWTKSGRGRLLLKVTADGPFSAACYTERGGSDISATCSRKCRIWSCQ